MAPMISIVIPAFNAGKTLEYTLKSVFKQTVQDFEIIIVDDGSQDTTLGTARQIAASNPHVQVITQKNGGESAV